MFPLKDFTRANEKGFSGQLRTTRQKFGGQWYPSRAWFRSTDLWVMGPARFLCATLLVTYMVILTGEINLNILLMEHKSMLPPAVKMTRALLPISLAKVKLRTYISQLAVLKLLPQTAWPSGLRRQTQVKTCLPEAGLSVLTLQTRKNCEND
ncbi:hypothetical protein M514_16285 [Trichuris suis]|uniref:Uncharacterized protein n=1 Tax=Trichuris suis TaxID=68888 RepID=A0A085NPF7_9BILA|nr:hypothetical protein M514_16285 [Trichuris suis]